MTQAHETAPCILFVDDEPSILSALRRLFRPEGYRVLVADSGEAGLRVLAQEQVDLVVSDMRMPEMDGAQFLQTVKVRWPQVMRVLLTGYADITATIAAINKGEIHRHLSKPIDEQEMVGTIKDVLHRARLEREVKELTRLTGQQNIELRELNRSLESRVKARTAELEQVNDMLNKTYEQLHKNYLISIQVFSGLLELRDNNAAGHSRDVANMARRIAELMELGAPAIQDVYIAGLLLDVGKLGFPDSLIRKPLSLMSSEEALRFRRHPIDAETTLLPLQELGRVAKYVRWQHERIDGRGFPDGIFGEQLPLQSQILSAVSDYFGLQTRRVAEHKHTAAEALASIKGGAGSRYERKVVDAFLIAAAEPPLERKDELSVSPKDLLPGMVLARDLISSRGTLLLAAGFVFDARIIHQLRDLVERESIWLTLYVKQMPQTLVAGKR